MTVNKPPRRGWIDNDDAPDLSAPEYSTKFTAVPVRRGRWQSRLNAALREILKR